MSSVSSFPEHRQEALLTERLEEPLLSPSTSESLVATVLSSSGIALLIVVRFRDILELLTKSSATAFYSKFQDGLLLSKKEFKKRHYHICHKGTSLDLLSKPMYCIIRLSKSFKRDLIDSIRITEIESLSN